MASIDSPGSFQINVYGVVINPIQDEALLIFNPEFSVFQLPSTTLIEGIFSGQTIERYVLNEYGIRAIPDFQPIYIDERITPRHIFSLFYRLLVHGDSEVKNPKYLVDGHKWVHQALVSTTSHTDHNTKLILQHAFSIPRD